jgi:hypothetical protein
MRRLPPEPNVGDRVTAELIRELMRCIRERQILKGPNYALKETPNGTYIKIDVPKASSAAAADHGCWNIIIGERDGETVHFFGNQFYEDGELMLHELQLEDAVEDFVGQGEPEEGEEYSSADLPFVALKTPTSVNSIVPTELVGFASLAELQAAQVDFSMSIRPLYKFRHDGSVAVDFRNCPNIQVAEALAFTQSSPASGS